MMISRTTEKFAQAILAWAKKNLRDFPWRKTDDSYRILIAEIMLQRTKAEQVVPVYKHFIMRFPDVNSLSMASESEIMKEIVSLGLKKRAKGLSELAEQLVRDYRGKIPRSRDELVKLHWVGNYIANAVLCHAFGENAPTVDANFARILERVFSLKLKHPAQKDKLVWDYAESLMSVVRGNCRKFNLGILDLASSICTARKPSCGICPISKMCDYGSLVLKASKHLPPRRRPVQRSILRRT